MFRNISPFNEMHDMPTPQEGQLYKVVVLHGHSFPLHYGYYEEWERENPSIEPMPIYPDFLKQPRYTAEGYPFVTKMQDPCKHYQGKEGSHDHDGYLTFVDKIGEYMQISDIKGIVVGNRLFSGAALASALGDAGDKLGTVENPTTAGHELIRSVKERLGIDSTAQAQALVADAYDKGQLAYTSDAEFSHYIGWQADADGNYLDFWYEDMATSQYHADAAYIMKSYGFLGDTTVVPGVSNTDMMYMTVRIATQITTGESIITWKIPASLIPTITYLVDVEVNEDGQIQRLVSLETEANTADSPIRLVYEVELREDIKDWNITQKVPDPEYTTHKAAGYVFYTNKWSNSGAEDVTRNTYSHFEPSVENERYYYTQDTQVLVKNGESYTPYTGAKPAGSGYYHAYQVFEKLENGSAVNNVAKFTFEPLEFTSVGQYYFKLTEIPGSQSSRIDYSDAQYIIQVTVSDDNEGGLHSQWRVVDTNGQPLADQMIRFVNVYTPVDLQVALRGIKTLQGKELEGSDFNFTLTKTQADFATVIRELETVSNNINGEIAFSPLTFSAGTTGYALGTHYFVITEQIPAEPAGGITYDTTEYQVTVTVENDGSGQLKETVRIVAKDVIGEQTLLVPADSIAFDNLYAYSGTVPVVISGEKNLTGKDMAAKDFTFELYDKDNNLVKTATNDINGGFAFEPLSFDQVGTHTYTVVEKNTGAMGMTYDTSVYTVEITVSDNGQGGLTAQKVITLDGKAAQLVFNNSFETQKVSVDVEINKTVKSASVKNPSPEGFEFLLVDETGKEVGRVKSDKNGEAKLTLEFTQEQIGTTFRYQLSEVNTRKTGVTYSDAVYAIEITPEATAEGKLAAKCKLDGKQTEKLAAAFVNTYELAATPQTGDNFPVVMMSIMVLSIICMAVLTIGKKKETANA